MVVFCIIKGEYKNYCNQMTKIFFVHRLGLGDKNIFVHRLESGDKNIFVHRLESGDKNINWGYKNCKIVHRLIKDTKTKTCTQINLLIQSVNYINKHTLFKHD